MKKHIKEIKSLFDLLDVKDKSFEGKNGHVLRVNEAKRCVELSPYTTVGAPIIMPDMQIRVSVDHGNDATGSIGNFDNPFRTIFGAAEYARGLITSDPGLANKILIIVEQGEYLNEKDIMFDGQIHCDNGVVIRPPNPIVTPLIVTHHDGESFMLTGNADIITEDLAGDTVEDDVYTAFRIHLEANKFISDDFVVEADEVYIKFNYFKTYDTLPRLYLANANINIGYWEVGNGGRCFIYTMPSITAVTTVNNININIGYFDSVAQPYSSYFFRFYPPSDDFDTHIKMHIDGGDHGNKLVTDTPGALIYAVFELHNYLSYNTIHISSNGASVSEITQYSRSKNITVSGTWNCYHYAFERVEAITLKDLTVTSINDYEITEDYLGNYIPDVDVIGSLTMITGADPKVTPSTIINYISDFPTGSGGAETVYNVKQLDHGFTEGDFVSNTQLGWIKANFDNPADGMVIVAASPNVFTVAMGGIIQNDLYSFIKGQTYWLDFDGTYTTSRPVEAQQSLFTAIETDTIVIDINDLFKDNTNIYNESSSESFIFNIYIDTPQTVTLPFNSGFSYNCTVDWGDGTITNPTTWDGVETQHTYSTIGNFKVSISGLMESFNTHTSPATTFRPLITHVYALGNTGITDLSFFSCENLTILPEDLLGSLSNLTTLDSMFRYCTSLGGINDNFLKYAVNVTSAEYMFSDCTEFYYVPGELFSKCILIDSFAYTFNNTSLKNIPETLFSSNKSVTNFTGTFANCTKLDNPPDKLFWNNTKVTTFDETFMNTGIDGLPDNIFRYNIAVTSFNRTFMDSSIEIIPTYLFQYTTQVLTFIETFRNTVVDFSNYYIFRYNTLVTSFEGVFREWNNETGLSPDLFKYNTSVISFENAFRDSSIRYIYSGAFGSNILAENFRNCFNGSGIGSVVQFGIADGVFTNNVNALDFTGCFANITGLGYSGTAPGDSYYPNAEMFSTCVKVTSFEGVFENSDLPTIEPGFFANNVLCTNFKNAFANCTSLTGPVDELWVDYPTADGTECFLNATGLSNYADIPSNWK